MSTHPKILYEQLERNFHSIEQFNELVRASALYYHKHGPLNILKIFIPSRNKDNEGHIYLNDWDKDKCEQAVKDVVAFFARHGIADSYTTEVQDDGIYLAMTNNTSYFLTMNRYLLEARYIIRQGRKNGIIITADEWLRDFPFEFHAAWYNRNKFISIVVAYLRQDDHELFQKAIYDGRQNWLENYKYPKIEKWNPVGEFIPIYNWETKVSEEKVKEKLLKFKQDYN